MAVKYGAGIKQPIITAYSVNDSKTNSWQLKLTAIPRLLTLDLLLINATPLKNPSPSLIYSTLDKPTISVGNM